MKALPSHLVLDIVDLNSFEDLVLKMLRTLAETSWNQNACLFYVPVYPHMREREVLDQKVATFCM